MTVVVLFHWIMVLRAFVSLLFACQCPAIRARHFSAYPFTYPPDLRIRCRPGGILLFDWFYVNPLPSSHAPARLLTHRDGM